MLKPSFVYLRTDLFSNLLDCFLTIRTNNSSNINGSPLSVGMATYSNRPQSTALEQKLRPTE